MKKAKVIASTLAMAVMIMGAGYASWTDRVTLNTTVNTGYLDVMFDESLDSCETDSAYSTGSISYEGTANESYSIANVTLQDMYPGDEAHVTVAVKNNGTMPVMIDDLLNGAAIIPNDATEWASAFQLTGISAKIDNQTPTENFLDKGKVVVVSYSFEALDGLNEDATYKATIAPIFTIAE